VVERRREREGGVVGERRKGKGEVRRRLLRGGEVGGRGVAWRRRGRSSGGGGVARGKRRREGVERRGEGVERRGVGGAERGEVDGTGVSMGLILSLVSLRVRGRGLRRREKRREEE